MRIVTKHKDKIESADDLRGFITVTQSKYEAADVIIKTNDFDSSTVWTVSYGAEEVTLQSSAAFIGTELDKFLKLLEKLPKSK